MIVIGTLMRCSVASARSAASIKRAVATTARGILDLIMTCYSAMSDLAPRILCNALCVRCHNAGVFDTDKHYFHRTGTRAPNASSATCPRRSTC
jgi:hypothetical protein